MVQAKSYFITIMTKGSFAGAKELMLTSPILPPPNTIQIIISSLFVKKGDY